ncbi:hypothetical protein LO763_11690 [Glycomyces sp. A-F 0318]|uniref:hypothetical protein n=1 Tax=Glycomyces amatae TaxID=2881355 RepID=UPI001E592CA1|nr:hypothetical protein [Glycomyces amatae]MCD0444284.1 hypothetical protein [Glycomyces amatae]
MRDFTGPLVLGEGVLTWPPEEQRLGRFGSVSLKVGTDQYATFPDVPIEALARLSATVLVVCEAVIAPDPVRQLAPTLPEQGEEIDLGIGLVFRPDIAGQAHIAIGLAPIAAYWRGNEWLSPTALYRAHNHYVRLTLHPYRGFTTDVTRTADAA